MRRSLADVFMRRHVAGAAADACIVIVDADDASMIAMHEIAGLWTWPRERNSTGGTGVDAPPSGAGCVLKGNQELLATYMEIFFMRQYLEEVALH